MVKTHAHKINAMWLHFRIPEVEEWISLDLARMSTMGTNCIPLGAFAQRGEQSEQSRR